MTMRSGFVLAVCLALTASCASRAPRKTARDLRLADEASWPDDKKRVAILIGVDDYMDTGIQRLHGAVKDAHRLAATLEASAGFPRDHIFVLTTDKSEDPGLAPTRANILRRLSNIRTFLQTVPGSLVFFSFSGHGIERANHGYLLPSDAQLNDNLSLLEETSISVDSVTEWIRGSGARQAVFVLDTCRNDPVASRGDGRAVLGRAIVKGFDFNLANSGITAIARIYATEPGGRAFETDEGDGYFSLALARGLGGAAANHDGDVTLASLIHYLEVAVPAQVSLNRGMRQVPYASIEGYRASDLVMSKPTNDVPKTQKADNFIVDRLAMKEGQTPGPLDPKKHVLVSAPPRPERLPVLKELESPSVRQAEPVQLDESHALNLVGVVDAEPNSSDAPATLSNACAIYEKIGHVTDASRCYARLYADYPKTTLGKEALWDASRNRFGSLDFNGAIEGYRAIAEDPKFVHSPHRKEAMGIAATLMDDNLQHAHAATLYRKYSDSLPASALEGAQAYFSGCLAVGKAQKDEAQASCLREFLKKYGKLAAADDYAIRALMRLAETAGRTTKNGEELSKLYGRVRDEFAARKLPPATPTASLAAQSAYIVAEQRFKAFQKRELRFPTKPDQIKKLFEEFTDEAKAINEDFQKVWSYRDANWTLASFLRTGDVYHEFAQKLVRAAVNPPEDIARLGKMACNANAADCGVVEGQYKDAVYQFVTPVEEEAKKRWKDTLARAAQLGITNEYVKTARANLARTLPDEFAYMKDERVALQNP